MCGVWCSVCGAVCGVFVWGGVVRCAVCSFGVFGVVWSGVRCVRLVWCSVVRCAVCSFGVFGVVWFVRSVCLVWCGPVCGVFVRCVWCVFRYAVCSLGVVCVWCSVFGVVRCEGAVCDASDERATHSTTTTSYDLTSQS